MTEPRLLGRVLYRLQLDGTLFHAPLSRLAAVAAAVVLSFAITAHGAIENHWQLTFIYSPAGLFLVKAAPIPPTTKQLRTPGLEGAVVKLDYTLEWLDANGAVLAKTPVLIPLGTRVALSGVEQMATHPTCLPVEGGFVLRVPGPGARVAESVRLSQVGPAVANAALGPLPPQQELPIAFATPVHTFALATARPLAAPPPAPSGPIGVVKQRNTGSDENRLVIATMGDGYTLTNLNSGAFSNQIVRFVNYMFGLSPWNSYVGAVNVYRIDIVSNQRGADYEDNSPANGGTLKDTYLNAAFWVGNTERCLFLTGDGVARAFAAADDFIGIGVWDEILVFVNSTKYGGCGGSVGVSSVNSAADEVQVHEFGHSFGGLGDEYDYGSTSTNCPSSLAPNLDCSTRFPSVKWNVWVTPGTPIPTPDTAQYDNAVGAFEGGGYQTRGIYRPKRNCRMRSLNVAFCPICKEAHIFKLFDQVTLLDGATPPFGPAEVPEGGTRSFTVAPLSVTNLLYAWTLDGAPLIGETGPSVTISSAQVTTSNELRVTVTHTNVMMRTRAVQDTFAWRLNRVTSPSFAVSSLSLDEGDSGTMNAIFTITLSYPVDHVRAVDYATVDGTAQAGSDYLPSQGLLSFQPQQTTQWVMVPIVGERMAEPNELFFLRLNDDRHLQGTCLIRDDDSTPTVALTTPSNGVVVSASASLTLSAEAVDPDGRVAAIEFFSDALKVGEDNFRPYSVVWTNLTPGEHLLTAVAWDNTGQAVTSAPVRVFVVPSGSSPLALVAVTNQWRYDASRTNFGTAWVLPAFDDSGWAGPSNALFYNESASLPAPKNTLVPLTDGVARLRGYYFRTTFTYPSNPPPGVVFLASNLVDDGAVFYLNGGELGRLRMPNGPISRTTLATNTPPFNGDALNYEVLTFTPGTNLVAGTNLLAVEVHQQSDSSSDVVFGMSLTAELGLAPIILDAASPADRAVEQGRATSFSVVAAGAAPLRYQWFRGGSPLFGATNSSYSIASMQSSLAGNYFCRVSNVLGTADSRTAELIYVPDTIAPVPIFAVRNLNLTNITISFAESLSSSTVTNVAQYLLTSAAGDLPVQRATLFFGTNIVLTTALANSNLNYWLTLSGVRDLWNNTLDTPVQMLVASEVLLVAGDQQPWRYFQSDRAPALGWWARGFDDETSGWQMGPALFDAKRPPGRIIVGPNAVPVRTMLNLTNPPGADEITLSYYFRTTFELPGPAVGARLQLRTLLDDGGVFYLNGIESFRLGLPNYPAPIIYSTLATRSQVDSQNVYEGPYDLPATNLIDGLNLLAAEVHQQGTGSSDLSFSAQLVAILPSLYETPALRVVRQGGTMMLQWNDPRGQLQFADVLGASWQDVTPPPTNSLLITPDQPQRFYRLRVP